MYLPLFQATGFREGYLSGQVDPRSCFDKAAMLEQALDLHALNPNVMVKVPGTAEGYDVIEELTARGVSTNNTLTFVLSQLMDCARSVERGVAKARQDGVDLSKWRSVITHMQARFGDLGGLREAGREKGIELSEGDVRLAELAILKKAYRLLKQGEYQSKLLPCSLRVGPTVDGALRVWHLEEMTGADVVVTVPPFYVDEIVNFPNAEKIDFQQDRIDVDPPKAVMDKLMRIPYFERAYEENGYTRAEYNSHPGVAKTAEEFSASTQTMVEFAGSCLATRLLKTGWACSCTEPITCCGQPLVLKVWNAKLVLLRGVDPLLWTPEHWGLQSPERESTWHERTPPTRRSSALKRSAWPAPAGDHRRRSPVTWAAAPRRSRAGSARRPSMRARPRA